MCRPGTKNSPMNGQASANRPVTTTTAPGETGAAGWGWEWLRATPYAIPTPSQFLILIVAGFSA